MPDQKRFMIQKIPRPAPVRLLLIIICFLFLFACNAHEPRRTSQNDPYRQFGIKYTPLADSTGFVETGVASWYGHDFHGKRTSSGEVYDMQGLTAAHKTLPLGTRVMVINPANGRSVIVRINDRGPFVDGRVIDLSYAAAEKLGISMTGTGRVVVVALDRTYTEPSPDQGDAAAVARNDRPGEPAFSLQVGSFASRKNAEALQSILTEKYENVFIAAFQEGPGTFYRVRVGRYVTREAADRALRQMVRDGYHQARLVTDCPRPGHIGN